MSAKHDARAFMAICSEKTLQSNAKGFFMQFADSVAESAGEKWIGTVFGKLKSDRERIRIIYHDAAVRDTVKATLSHVQEIYRKKSAEVSQARRLDAEKLMKSGDFHKASLLASQSVLRAPKTGENPRVDQGISLSHALWTRSEVWMHLKRYTLALSDVQLAMKENLHGVYKAEAFWRMAICYKALGEDKRAKVSAQLAEKLLQNDSAKIELLRRSMEIGYVEDKQVSKKVMPTLANKHTKYPNATNKMIVKEETGKGRYAVASKQIATGEIIAAEWPYAACLLPDCFGTHCHNCFERLQSPIGCSDCSSVAFCSADCKDLATKNYHRYECKFLDLMIGSGMSILAHTALRMVTQNAPERMYEIGKNRNAENVYSLCTLSEKRTPGDFLQRTLMAAFLLRCLQKSGYFGYVDEDVVPNENQLTIGELLLYHLQMLQFNAHEIYETVCVDNHRFRNAKARYIGVAVYPTVALFNHECHAAVTRYFVGKNIVINAIRPINPGEEISENYGPVFARKTLPMRQKSLSGRYWFNCECQACVQDWPMMDAGLENVTRKVRCPNKHCNNYFSLPAGKDAVNCVRCKQEICLTDNAKVLKACVEQFEAGFACADKEEVDKGIAVLSEALDTFHRVSIPPHREAHLAQECLRALMADSGNVHMQLQ